MTKKFEVYKCEICGNVVEVLDGKGPEIICCGQPMTLFEEKTEDIGKEKHIPVIEGNKIKVGSIEHPMEEKHFIEWIEAINGNQKSKVFLKPGDKPEAEFCFKPKQARIYCNLHGLWKSK